MAEKPEQHENAKIDRLVAFFKSLKTVHSGPGRSLDSHVDFPIGSEDDPAWNQTEEQYQAEQAKWLAGMNAKKMAKIEFDK